MLDDFLNPASDSANAGTNPAPPKNTNMSMNMNSNSNRPGIEPNPSLSSISSLEGGSSKPKPNMKKSFGNSSMTMGGTGGRGNSMGNGSISMNKGGFNPST